MDFTASVFVLRAVSLCALLDVPVCVFIHVSMYFGTENNKTIAGKTTEIS